MDEHPANEGTSDAPQISAEDAQKLLLEVESQIADMEHAGATTTQVFLDLLRNKIQLCTVLKKFKEVNNTESRVRFIEARIRGEVPAHAEIISMDRARRRDKRNKTNSLMLVSIALFVMILGSVPLLKSAVEHKRTADGNIVKATGGGTVEEINRLAPGERIDLASVLQPNQTTVVYFHSDDCPPCERLMPQYIRLAEARPDIRFYTVDLDRVGTRGIDFESPVAQQFEIRSIPYVVVYEGTQEVVSGPDAIDRLNQMRAEAEPAK